MSRSTPSHPARRRLRRLLLWANVFVFVLSVVTIAASANYFALRPALRTQLDSTKTRAYSLSPQTKSLLAQLEGDWRIALLYVEEDFDLAVRRQIDEVLQRYDEAGDALTVERIDPTDPQSIARYEALLQRLRGVFGEEIERYEAALGDAGEHYARLLEFAREESVRIRGVLGALSSDDRFGPDFKRIHNELLLTVQRGSEVTQRVAEALEISDSQPVPDYEAARDVLAAALQDAAVRFDQIAEYFESAVRGGGLPVEIQGVLARARPRYEQFAVELQSKADPLVHLPPLELTSISRELTRGQAAIVTSDDRAAVIPAAQLLPGNIRTTREGGITFDQRFRGEQIISSTIQSLLVDVMPMVVFVHAQPQSMLKRRESGVDLFGVSTILEASRYDVREWIVGQDEGPEPAEGQPAVYIVVPPPFVERLASSAFEPSKEELALVETARRLIQGGESVLLSFYPSTMHKFRQPDPWQGLMSEFELEADTSQLIMEASVGATGEEVKTTSLQFAELPVEHAIARAVSGQQLLLPLAVPIEIAGNPPTGVRRWALAKAAPAANRWLEPDWTQGQSRLDDPTEEQRFERPIPVVVAAARPRPIETGEQRLVAVGSGQWLHSQVADRTISLGGERKALLFPGNIELLQASVAWLAGMDELIAQSPTAQQVSRLDGVSEAVHTRWQWLALAGLPGACLGFGILMWFFRRL